MKFYDIFNGDADGICALQQLRLEEPRDSVLVTGVKRDIRLLDRVDAGGGDELTVLDISLRTNAKDLSRLLAVGARCRYFDHHAPGDIPNHPNLRTFVDTAPDTCTSLIVDRYLNGRHRLWAVVAAFGDNLAESALRAAATMLIDGGDLERLQRLGEVMNYNAYGETVDDLHYHPADLFEALRAYRDPLDFINSEPVYDVLSNALGIDMEQAEALIPALEREDKALYVLPDAAWSRRIHGHFGNRVAITEPERANAVLVKKAGGYTVSVRAPRGRPVGADLLCLKFETGGGRKAAAGINFLPESDYSRFVAEFEKAFAA